MAKYLCKIKNCSYWYHRFKFYGFRADLIRSLVANGHQVYAFTSEYTENCLDKIKVLGAVPVTYELSRGGLNPFADIASTYQLIRKIKNYARYRFFIFC